MRPLPTTPSRYISFITSYSTSNRTPHKTFWRIVENGEYASPGVSSFEVILTLWAADPPSTVYDELQEEFVPLMLGA